MKQWLRNLYLTIGFFFARLMIKAGVAMGAQVVMRHSNIEVKVIRKDGRIENLGIVAKGVSNL